MNKNSIFETECLFFESNFEQNFRKLNFIFNVLTNLEVFDNNLYFLKEISSINFLKCTLILWVKIKEKQLLKIIFICFYPKITMHIGHIHYFGTRGIMKINIRLKYINELVTNY